MNPAHELGTSASPDRPDAARGSDAASALRALARALHVRRPGVQGTLDAILLTAVEVVDVDFVGVNLLLGSSFEPQAVLGEAPNALDRLQQQTGTGPCIDASRDQQAVHVEDMALERRWPKYAELAVSLEVRSMLCVPMWVDELRLGSISLYSRHRGPFSAQDHEVADLLAVHAAVALSDAQRIENLGLALRNRDVIGQAKGILMERDRITAEAAFTRLSQASQRLNRKLVVVAEELVTSGTLP